jgi:hypothetical protein
VKGGRGQGAQKKGIKGLRMTVEGGRREVALRRSEPRRLGRSFGGFKVEGIFGGVKVRKWEGENVRM